MENLLNPSTLPALNPLQQDINPALLSQQPNLLQYQQQIQQYYQQQQQQFLLSQFNQQMWQGLDFQKLATQLQLQQELQHMSQQMCLSYIFPQNLESTVSTSPKNSLQNNNQMSPLSSPLNFMLAQNNLLQYAQSTVPINQQNEDSVKEDQDLSQNTQGSQKKSNNNNNLKRKNPYSIDSYLDTKKQENIGNKKVKKNSREIHFPPNSFNKNLQFQGSDWLQGYFNSNQQVRDHFKDAKNPNLDEKQVLSLYNNFLELVDANSPTEEINLLTDQEHKKNIYVFKPQNMPHLLMNKILRQFTMENLEKIAMPSKLRNKLGDIFRECKTYLHLKETKEMSQQIRKLYVYNHSHFNLLFLSLNQISIKKMLNLKNQMDVEMHETIFGIDFLNINEEQIQFVNFLKKCFYELTMKYVTNNEMEKSGEQFYQYQKKAFESMQLLSNGQLILRF